MSDKTEMVVVDGVAYPKGKEAKSQAEIQAEIEARRDQKKVSGYKTTDLKPETKEVK